MLVNTNVTSGYKSAKGGGGSKKGKKTISWLVGKDKPMIKIICQEILGSHGTRVEFTRNFGGAGQLEILRHEIEKHFPEVYEELLWKHDLGDRPRTEKEQRAVLYDRGHKGYYWNDGEKNETGRPRVSREHWTQSKRLNPFYDAAMARFGKLLGITPSRGKLKSK